MGRALEPRGTLNPLWNIIPDWTIFSYNLPQFPLTHIIKKTHASEKATSQQQQKHIKNQYYYKHKSPSYNWCNLACKTVQDYNRNRKKIKVLFRWKKANPEEPTTMKETSTQVQKEPSTSAADQARPSSQQAPTPRPTCSQKRRTERKQKKASPSKRTTRQIKTSTPRSNKNRRKQR